MLGSLGQNLNLPLNFFCQFYIACSVIRIFMLDLVQRVNNAVLDKVNKQILN